MLICLPLVVIVQNIEGKKKTIRAKLFNINIFSDKLFFTIPSQLYFKTPQKNNDRAIIKSRLARN